jgi:hypothetical protein
MKPAVAPLKNRASLFKQTEPPLRKDDASENGWPPAISLLSCTQNGSINDPF